MESCNILSSDSSVTKRELTKGQQRIISEDLLKESSDGILKLGSQTLIARDFNVSCKTICSIWKKGNKILNGGIHKGVFSERVEKVGRKKKMIKQDEFTVIPYHQRTNIRSIVAKLNMSKSTVHNRLREVFAKRHSNPTKPLLTKLNEKSRLEFCISMIDHEKSNLNGKPTFIEMYDRVHIDEKWFYMTKKSQNFYLLHDEIEPVRAIKSKNFITKIMFMTVVARPRFIVETNEWFDRKIGVFSFVCTQPARRSSKNRVVGTMETNPILIINKDVIRSCLIEKVLPVNREKWPKSDRHTTIYIQQDNARPHTKMNDPEFIEAAKQDGFDIRLCFQPPNSPDMNVLDLGFFASIQALQHREAPNSIDQLVAAVQKSFDEYESDLLNDVFLSLQQTMVEVLKVLGKNNYKSPHMFKGKLKRIDQLPISVSFEDDILKQATIHLQQMDMLD